MLTALHKNIESSLADLLDKAGKDYHLTSINPFLFASLREYILRPGKRIRPLLLILSYQGYRADDKKLSKNIYTASASIELLHNFMLIHDDIIDCARLRRGKPAMHRMLSRTVPSANPDKLGLDLGIIAGDIVYALAIDAFLSFNEEPERMTRALRYFVQSAAMTAMGEFVDTLNGVLPASKVTEDDVFLNYALKTARYTFECPLVAGAMLAGADAKETRRLSELGLMTGQAFQIQDDIIGIFETEKNIGKSVLSDLAESKKTILVCHACAVLPGARRREFLGYLTKPQITYADLRAVRKIFLESGSLRYAFDHMRRRLDRSEQIITSLTMRPKYKTLVKASLDKLFQHAGRIASSCRIPF